MILRVDASVRFQRDGQPFEPDDAVLAGTLETLRRRLRTTIAGRACNVVIDNVFVRLEADDARSTPGVPAPTLAGDGPAET